MKRQNIDLYFIDIANMVGSRGTCDRGHSGCVIVKDKQMLISGYVGSPIGMPHCDTDGHLMEDNSCVRTTHAEQNAIVNAAKNGVSINGGELYCTMFPCYACAKMIINAGIKRVIIDYDYHASDKSKKIFMLAGVGITLIHSEIKKYD